MGAQSLEAPAADTAAAVADAGLKLLTRQLDELSPQERARVEAIAAGIDINDSQQMIQYGIGAQSKISEFADNILGQVRSKDTGHVGELMTDLLINVKTLDVDDLEEEEKKFRLFRRAKNRFARFAAQYETVDVQLDKIANELDRSRMALLKDIGMFDLMYQKNLEYFRDLQLYILAGEKKLREIHESVIPELDAKAAASLDPMDAQKANDARQMADRFEKKLYDIKLSRTIAIQTAPQIRLIQNNDKMLVEKIQTSIINTLPLWKNQIILAIGLRKQRQALGLQQQVNEATNELLLKNSAMLKQSTLDVVRESEKGIVEISTLKTANENLITTIEEAIRIQQEGRTARQNAEVELARMEGELRDRLLRASTGQPGGTGSGGSAGGTGGADTGIHPLTGPGR
ncbi:MAG: toxic anion resistance protein [Clostridia bacterium]|nr:toxic anion resistance protein [Clostridia bacterium]